MEAILYIFVVTNATSSGVSMPLLAIMDTTDGFSPSDPQSIEDESILHLHLLQFRTFMNSHRDVPGTEDQASVTDRL